MKTLLVSMLLLSAVSAHATSGISCSLVNDFDDYAIEVAGGKAAFFDNDKWVEARFTKSLEIAPPIYVYTSVDPADHFTISIQQMPMPSGKIYGSLNVEVNGKYKKLALNCSKVAKLNYL